MISRIRPICRAPCRREARAAPARGRWTPRPRPRRGSGRRRWPSPCPGTRSRTGTPAWSGNTRPSGSGSSRTSKWRLARRGSTSNRPRRRSDAQRWVGFLKDWNVSHKRLNLSDNSRKSQICQIFQRQNAEPAFSEGSLSEPSRVGDRKSSRSLRRIKCNVRIHQ